MAKFANEPSCDPYEILSWFMCRNNKQQFWRLFTAVI